MPLVTLLDPLAAASGAARSDLHAALAAGAALVATAFSMATFERWLARRRRHELAWSGSLALFALASAALVVGASVGWSGPVFRAFYLFGAVLNVPFLALGTLYLLLGQERGDRWAAAICLVSAFAAGVVLVAPFTGPIPTDRLPQGSEVFGPAPRILAAVGSGVAALVVVGGALWSAWKQRTPRYVLSNLLIASGTLVTGASGILNSVFDEMTGFAVALAVGITLLFAGFLVATTGPALAKPVRRLALLPTEPRPDSPLPETWQESG